MYVNGSDQDAQLIINQDGCADDEVRLAILNHDEGEAAYLIVEKAELLKRIKEATK